MFKRIRVVGVGALATIGFIGACSDEETKPSSSTGGTGGSAGAAATGGSAGRAPTGGSAGAVATGGSAGAAATGGSAGSATTGGSGGETGGGQSGETNGGSPGEGGQAGQGGDGTVHVVIVETRGTPELLAAGPDDLYWIEEDGSGTCVAVLKKIPFSGRTQETIAQMPGSCPVDFALNTTDAYLLEVSSSRLLRVPLDGSPVVVIAPATGGPYSTLVGGVALDETSVYWTLSSNVPPAWETLTPATPGAILKAPLAGGQVETLTLLPADRSGAGGMGGAGAGGMGGAGAGGMGGAGAGGMGGAGDGGVPGGGRGGLGGTGLGGTVGTGGAAGGGGMTPIPATANDVAVDATHVYYTVDDGTVMRIRKTGGVPELLAANQQIPNVLIVDDETVYWSNLGDGRIMKVSKSGGTPVVLSSLGSLELARPWSWVPASPLLIDDTFLYWRNWTAGEVMKVPTAGGRAQSIAFSNLAYPAGVAVGPERVYWVSDLSIMAAPK